MNKKHKSIKERFFEKVHKTNSCWFWLRSLDKGGYGSFHYIDDDERSHRASWMIHFGEIPARLHVLHKCDNASCVNPKHLFLGNNADNMKDRLKKGGYLGNIGESNPNSKLTNEQVKEIKSQNLPQRKLANMYGVNQRVIWAIKNGVSWKHV